MQPKLSRFKSRLISTYPADDDVTIPVARYRRNTRRKNEQHRCAAEYLTALGIDLREVRVVGNEEGAIIDAINALRHRYTYVFTTGGIGPTHDDITSDCVAKAFGVPIDVDPRALDRQTAPA